MGHHRPCRTWHLAARASGPGSNRELSPCSTLGSRYDLEHGHGLASASALPPPWVATLPNVVAKRMVHETNPIAQKRWLGGPLPDSHTAPGPRKNFFGIFLRGPPYFPSKNFCKKRCLCSGHVPCFSSAAKCALVPYPLCTANPYSG